MDRTRTHAQLASAALQLKGPAVIIRENPVNEALKAENERLRAQLARRTRLEDATIRAGSPRYESGSETPVIALVGRTQKQPIGSAKKQWWKLW